MGAIKGDTGSLDKAHSAILNLKPEALNLLWLLGMLSDQVQEDRALLIDEKFESLIGLTDCFKMRLLG